MEAQNKELYLKHMNEEYREKHYPERSVFAAHKKTQKGANAVLSLFFIGLFLAGSLAGFVWSINRIQEIIRDAEEDMLGIGIGISVFFLLLAIGFGALIYVIVKGMRKSADDWIRIVAKAGGLSEQEVREFDRQAMEPDSLILIHLGKLKSFAAGQKDGILTRDYICLYNNNMPRVLKLDRLTEAHLKDNTYYVKVGKTQKKAHYLTINLMSRDNKTAWAETSQESARALQEELVNRCPGIDTAGGAVLAE